jgi:AcrR family transcriptional regulator
MLVTTNQRKVSRTGKQRLASGERRVTILDAAIRLFAERGFRGTTTRELAALVGVTEPVLYQHFETKRELYSAIIETKSREGEERFKTVLGPYLETDDDRRFFSLLAELILEPYTKDVAYIRLLLFSAMEGHELAELFYERKLLCFYKMVSGYIERRMKQEAFRRMDASLATRAFVGMVSNFGLVRMLFPDKRLRQSQRKAIEGMVNLFLEGISNPI